MRVLRAFVCLSLIAAAVAVVSGYPTLALVARGNGHALAPSISASGNLVAFYATATNLATGAPNPSVQVRDMTSGTFELASAGLTGTVSRPTISRDGTAVVFYASPAPFTDVQPYFYNLVTHTLTVIPTTSTVGAVDANTPPPAVSDAVDGRHYVAFEGLNINPWEPPPQILVWDSSTGVTVIASRNASGASADQACSFPALSADGSTVAFLSTASNLVSPLTRRQVLLATRTSGVWTTSEIVSQSTGGALANRDADWPSMSADGSTVAFATAGSNLFAGDDMASRDVFVRDRIAGTTTLAYLDRPAVGMVKSSNAPSLSADGDYVGFVSERLLDDALDMHDAD